MTIKERSFKFLSDSQKNQKDPNNSKKEKFRFSLGPNNLFFQLDRSDKRHLDRLLLLFKKSCKGLLLRFPMILSKEVVQFD